MLTEKTSHNYYLSRSSVPLDQACLCSQKVFSKQTSFMKNFILMSFYWLCVRVDHMVKMPKKRVGGCIFRKETELSNDKTGGGGGGGGNF